MCVSPLLTRRGVASPVSHGPRACTVYCGTTQTFQAAAWLCFGKTVSLAEAVFYLGLFTELSQPSKQPQQYQGLCRG